MMRKFCYGLAAFLTTAVAVVAQPANDLCENRQIVPGPGAYSFNTTGAGNEAASCPYYGDIYPTVDVWYEFAASQSGTFQFGTVDCGTVGYAQVSIYDSCGGVLLACAADTCNEGPLNFDVTHGQTYVIRVATYDPTNGPGTFVILPPPSADSCAAATPLTTNSVSSFNTATATNTPIDVINTCLSPSQASANDVWFSYKPDFAGMITVLSRPIGSIYDTNISVYDACNGGNLLACGSANVSSGVCSVNLSVTLNQTVYIRVGANDNIGHTGTIEVGIPPANDNCVGAITILDGELISFSNELATSNNLTTCDAFAAKNFDLWYRYVPNHDGEVAFSTCGSQTPFVLSVHSDFCGAPIACGISSICMQANGSKGFAFAPVTAGNAVYARVSSSFFQSQVGSGQIRADFASPPVNDLCVNASTVSAGDTEFSTFGATTDGAVSCIDANLGGSNDIWYRFMPSVTGYADIGVRSISSEFSHGHVTAFAACGGQQVFCENDLVRVAVISGQPITLRVSSALDYLYAHANLSIAEHAVGASQYFEGNADLAGELTSEAVDLSGRNGLTQILGTLSINDRADIYKIRICQPTMFSIATNLTDTFGRPVPAKNIFVFNEQGGGVTASTLDTTPINGTLIPAAGVYYVAVSNRFIPSDFDLAPIWTDISGNNRVPNGPGAGGVLGDWVAQSAGGPNVTTAYTLTLTGLCACAADFNNVNGVTVQDIFDFLTAWLAGNASADFNHVNGVTVQDIFDFLTAWLAGC